MHRRRALPFISVGFSRRSLYFAFASFIAFSCLVIPIGHVQAGVDASASVARFTQQAIDLELGKPIERELAGGQKHRYQITLAEGQYASVVVEQRGIDIVARVLGPDGKQIAEFDDELRPQGREKPELVAVSSGGYTLDIVAKRQDAPAGSYEVRLAELRAATETDRLLQDARGLLAESTRLGRAGKYDEALLPAATAVEAREKTLGPEHPSTAAAINTLAIIYYSKGDLDKAEPLYQRVLRIREKAFGPDDPGVASVLNNIAEIYRLRGDYTAAEPLYRRSIQSWEKSLGPDHPIIPIPLTNLAIVRRVLGDYVESELLYQRALEIREKALGPNHLEVAASLNNLGALYMIKGDLPKAELMLQHALQIYEDTLGPEHPNCAAVLDNLANIEHDRGDLDKAEQLYQRALKISEKAFGPEHPSFAASLDSLATVFLDRGDLDNAESLVQRALEIREKALGPEHPDVAVSLYNLAKVYSVRGNFDKAEPLYQRALKIREDSLGHDHPGVSELLTNMAACYAASGDGERAITTQAHANAIIERNIALNLVAGSERQKLAYLTTLSEMTDRTLSLHLRTAPDSREARELAVTTIFQRKGRVQDAMSDDLSGLRRRFNAQDRKLLDSLNGTTGKLARLVLNGPGRMSLAEHQQQIEALEEQKEQIENEISRRSAGFYTRAEPVTLGAVQAAIPAPAALIEISTYRPFDPKARGDNRKAYGEPRYAAYVLRHEGEVTWKDLGGAKPIDEAIDAFREALRDPKRSNVKQRARAVDEKVMQPLAALVGDATQLLISPDGALNLIPFEALVDEQNHYLVERFSCTYLTSARDLLRLQVARASKSPPLVVADPLFGEPELTVVAQANTPKRGPANRKQPGGNRRQSVTTGSDLSNVYFARLSGTAQEAQSIKSLFAEANVLTGTQATESSLKQVSAPRIMHIATHGFFLTNTPPPPSSASGEKTRAISGNLKVENPLLRAGLALAGANLHKRGDDDGILTALEASGMNLWGTKLVTLSACDTGVGEVRNGEGVYGLRRAFMLAGTETLVMSLWPVSDYVTRELMTAYYKGLKQGLGRGESLRQVQLAMLKRKGREHPFYWASFIQSGEWANLEGKR